MFDEERMRQSRIAVVGAGLMGSRIGLEFARRGFAVSLNDVSAAYLSRSLGSIETDLRWMAKQGLVAEEQIEAILARVQTNPDLAAAVEGADFVVEAVLEDLDLKRRLFADLDRFCAPHTVLASNTSGLSANRLAEATHRPDRVLVTHFWNPPHLVPLVEVVRADATSAATLDLTAGLLRQIGKTLVVLKKEAPGFIGNRIQLAIMREAYHMIEEGIAGPEEIDTVMKLSLGPRYAEVGPLEAADLAGLDLHLSIAAYMFRELCAADTPSPVLQEKVQRGELGVKSGQGFYTWTPERREQVARTRDAELVRRLKQRSGQPY